MISKKDKNADRKVRHARVRKNLSGTSLRPRLDVYRSTKYIYAQIIDDVKGNTLVSSSTIAKGINVEGLTKVQASEVVGKDIAKKALEKGIKDVVFDRGGFIYQGKVQALADAAREAGLNF